VSSRLTPHSASYYYASVSGGDDNTANGAATSVSGGLDLSFSTDDGWAGGKLVSVP
jgi:3-hydroxyisobutyrate dehydrogenase-like beta-hydroxyacid dehydrogenase